jgi:hypothetical protein
VWLFVDNNDYKMNVFFFGVREFFIFADINADVASDRLDSISSRFNVLNMLISTTAPIDAKTHV